MGTNRTSFIIFLFVALTPFSAIGTEKPSFIIRDAEGTVIGPVLEQTIDLAATRGLTESSPLWVAGKNSDGWIFLPLSKNAVWATKTLTPFLYEGTSCSTLPLLQAPKTTDEVRATVIFDKYVYWSAGAASDRTIRSKGVRMAEPTTCRGELVDGNLCCTTLSGDETHYAGEVLGVALPSLNLQPPFQLERIVP